MLKKKLWMVIGILMAIVLSLVLVMVLLLGKMSGDSGEENYIDGKTGQESTEEEWNPEKLREGLDTVIAYDKQYNNNVPTKEKAEELIREYGVTQREQYDNPKVEAIELQMEEDYGILAVTLGEIDVETAKDVEKAFAYMYETYPELKGTLTNLTLGNFKEENASFVAETHYREFIINGEFGVRPTVVKHEIVLSAAKFRNRKALLDICATSVESGHWMEGTDISTLVVHELAHQLQNVIAMRSVGFQDIYYVTEENESAFSAYIMDGLSYNQTTAKEMHDAAYEVWQVEYGYEGRSDEFRGSISGYARGEQEDGGVSYGETFAEAIADVYLHGENAAAASRAFVKVAEERLLR